MTTEPVTFLLVEDDDVDVRAMQRAFKRMKIANPIVVARDGLEAMEHLRGENGREKLQRPYLVMLDLNMPRMNGREFLEEVREDAELRSSIVFVLTTSNDEKDRVEAYEKNVAGYIVKADAEKTFTDAVEMLDHYWRVVEFPT